MPQYGELVQVPQLVAVELLHRCRKGRACTTDNATFLGASLAGVESGSPYANLCRKCRRREYGPLVEIVSKANFMKDHAHTSSPFS
jgi:hypothetical protein